MREELIGDTGEKNSCLRQGGGARGGEGFQTYIHFFCSPYLNCNIMYSCWSQLLFSLCNFFFLISPKEDLEVV